MKNYVTKKDEKELWFLWKQIDLNLRKLHKKNWQLNKLNFKVLKDYLNCFLQNHYWRSKYKKAPSYICKLYIAIQYCRSYDVYLNIDSLNGNSNDETLLEHECRIAESYCEYLLTIEDLEYIRDTVASMPQAKMIYNNIAKLLRGLKDGDQYQIEPHGCEIYLYDYDEKYNKRDR